MSTPACVASLLLETSREVANKSLVLIMYRMKGHTKPIFFLRISLILQKEVATS